MREKTHVFSLFLFFTKNTIIKPNEHLFKILFMKTFSKVLAIFTLVLICQSFANIAQAKCTCGGTDKSYDETTCKAKQSSEGCSWTADAGSSVPAGQGVNLNNPIRVNSPQQLIGQVINAVLGIVGSIALLMFIWGGFLWMTAAGNDEKVQQGKKTLTWSTLGLVVIFSSYALVSYLIKNIVAGK